MTAWVVIGLLVVVTLALKTVGPLVAGGRRPPDRLVRVIGLLGPALIAGLIVTGTVTSGGRLVVDARLVGLAVGGCALWLRAPVIIALVLAAGTCALVRLLV